MGIQGIKLLPGVDLESTAVLAAAQPNASNLIRWKQTAQTIVPEKLGGWNRFYPTSLGSAVRDLHAWEGINADSHLAAGCTASLNVISSGTGIDITPRTFFSVTAVSFNTTNGSRSVSIDDPNFTGSIYDSIYLLTPVAVGGIVLQGAYLIDSVADADTYFVTAASAATSTVTAGGAVPTFTTTNGQPFVTVALTNHGLAVGEIFNIPAVTATTVGGITLSGAYVVRSVTDASHFVITAAQAATSGATASMNGGNVAIRYYVGIGPSVPTAGYGSGGYGTGGYGLGVVPTPSPGSPITATNWTLDNWGEVLLACPANGPVYSWSPDSGLAVASRILEAPEINGGIFVAQPAQILVAWASSQGGVQDPLTINWSDAGDYTNWVVSSQTQAGGFRIPTGSRIVGGLAGPNFAVIWTDIEVWAMDYVEPPLVFGFNSLGQNVGLVARHGHGVLNSIVYWMSEDKFCLLNGETVQTIPCTVWDFIFQDLDKANIDKVYCGTNSLFGEVTWYFPSLSGGTGEVDSYVKYTPGLGGGIWDCGRLARSAWVDQSPVGEPIGGAPNGFLYQHEVSPDADGQPMNPYFETGYFSVNDGDMLSFLDWFFPDFKWGTYAGSQGAVVQITLSTTDYPTGGQAFSLGPYSVSALTPYFNPRLRARFVKMRVESNDLGSFWRLGECKVRLAPDGRR